MDRRLDWIARNGAFAVVLYFAAVVHVDWLQLVVTGFVWSTLAVTVWTMSENSAFRLFAPIPISPVGSMVFDLAVLGSMFVAHWYWTAFAFAMSCGCVAIARARATSKP
jgi:hypothetical protein